MTASTTRRAASCNARASSCARDRSEIEVLRKLAVSLLLICSIVGCRSGKEPSTTGDAVRYFEQDSTGAFTRDTPGITCSYPYALTLLGFQMKGTGCWHFVADTLYYSYATGRGEILLRGKRISVPAERLSRMTDSLQHALSARFGIAVDCKTSNEIWNTTNFSYWRRKGQTFFLRSTIVSGTATSMITLEAAQGERTCNMYVGGPPAYY
jgi:hypothetical protein